MFAFDFKFMLIHDQIQTQNLNLFQRIISNMPIYALFLKT